jgi:hypothetical protein
MILTPRLQRFEHVWTDQELDALIEILPKTIVLVGSDVTAQSKVLHDAMRSIFVPDVQIRRILRILFSLAKGHAETYFDTDIKYLAGLNSKLPWGSSMTPAYCLTGLAGVGKSEILSALNRLLAQDGKFSVLGIGNIPLDTVWPMTLANGAGLNQLLKEYVVPKTESSNIVESEIHAAHRADSKDLKLPLLLSLARRISWRNGVCLITIDEFQRIAAGDSANAKATSVLLHLQGIGPQLVYCPNYSLVHKLKLRKHEDRHRLLCRPIVVLPLQASDPDWKAYLTALKSVAPDVFSFDPELDAEIFHLYTFGLKRLAVELSTIAFRIARERNCNSIVGIKELLTAYRSIDYSVNREDVEILHKQAITGKKVRDDLWCPFTSTEITSTVKDLSTAVASFESRAENAFLASAMTPREAAALKELVPDTPSSTQSAKVIRISRKKTTKDDLLAGAAILDGLK